MMHPSHTYIPLDPGRIHADDPLEVEYWSLQLGCSPDRLYALMALHGNHVTVVREVLARSDEPRPRRRPDPARRRRVRRSSTS